jgi:hypothetical protein
VSGPRHQQSPIRQQSAIVLGLKRFSSVLLQVLRLLWWWLVAAFSTAGCCYCGYVTPTSWNRVRACRSGLEPAPRDVPLDASDAAAVARYAAAGVRDLEEYLAAWSGDRPGRTCDPTDPRRPGLEWPREGR